MTLVSSGMSLLKSELPFIRCAIMNVKWAWQRTTSSVAAEHSFTDSINQLRRCQASLSRSPGFSELTL